MSFVRSMARASAATAAFAGFALLTSPGAAAYLINPGFDTVGPGGSPVTTVGPSSAPSAALGWSQITVVPGGSFTTTLLPTTDPWGSGGMLHIVTDSGDWPPAQQGNGFGQGLIGAPLPNATVSYDIWVVSGSVTGGLTEDVSGVGGFPINTPTLGPTGGWIHVIHAQLPGQLSDGVAFETLTYGQGAGFGANYYLDNISVTVPAPAPGRGLASLGFLAVSGAAARRFAILRARREGC